MRRRRKGGECNTTDIDPHCVKGHSHRCLKSGSASCRDRYRRRGGHPIAHRKPLDVGHPCYGYIQGYLGRSLVNNRKDLHMNARKDPLHGPLVVHQAAT